MFNEGYEIPFAEALVFHEDLKLSNTEIEETNRKEFKDKYESLYIQWQDALRVEEERRQEALSRQKELLVQKQNSSVQLSKRLSYNQLKPLLYEKIKMNQKEQMELWTKFMPKIGFNNSQMVWDLVLEHDIQSFDELRGYLNWAIQVGKIK